MNPLYFWVGDSPESIDMCLTALGVKDKQLLCLRGGQSYLILLMHG